MRWRRSSRSASCSKKQPKTAGPAYYADSILAKAQELMGKGYELLDAKDLAGATAKFTEAGKLMPGALNQEYTMASAYARMDNKDEAFNWLTRLVDKGMDLPEWLEKDSEFESLQDDPRMKDLVDRARGPISRRGRRTSRRGSRNTRGPPTPSRPSPRSTRGRRTRTGFAASTASSGPPRSTSRSRPPPPGATSPR